MNAFGPADYTTSRDARVCVVVTVTREGSRSACLTAMMPRSPRSGELIFWAFFGWGFWGLLRSMGTFGPGWCLVGPDFIPVWRLGDADAIRRHFRICP